MVTRKSLVISAASSLLLVLIISVAPALLLKSTLNNRMLQWGAEQAEIESLYLNLWTGHIELSGLSATAQHKPALRIGALEADIRYRELWHKRLLISRLTLADAELPVTQGPRWQLGPLTLPEPDTAAETDPETAPPPSEWRAGIKDVKLTAIKTSLSNSQMSHRLFIDQAQLQRLQPWTPQQQTRFNLQGRINDSRIALASQGTPLAPQPQLELKLDLQQLALAPLARPWLDGLHGDLSTDLTLQLQRLDDGFQLQQSGTLSLTGFGVSQASLAVSSAQIDWQGRAQQQFIAGALVKTSSDNSLQIQQLALQLQQPALKLNAQQIELKGRLETDTKQLRFSGGLQTQVTQIQRQHLQLASQALQWQGAFGVNLASAAVTSLSGDINTGLLQVNNQGGNALISIERLRINQMELPQPNQLDVASLQLQHLSLADEPPLLTLDQLAISGIRGSPTRTLIRQIHPGEIYARVDLDSAKQPHRWLAWLEQLTGSQPATDNTAPDSKPHEGRTTYPVKLGEFALQKPALITLAEQTATRQKPGRPFNVTINTLTLAELDTTSDQASPFKLSARTARFGQVELAGHYSLFADAPNARWQGSISGMALPPFSPMMQSQTGYQIDSGKLELESRGTITAGLVDSTNHLVINNLSVNPTKTAATNAFDGKLGMPLGTAVSLLTDADDNVELDLPINGRISDPEFGIQSILNIVIAKVTRETALGYLAVTLQPYGALIGLTRLAVDAIEGSTIKLKPVYFEPGSAALTAQGVDYLSKIGQMLTERDGLRLKLCGQSVAADQAWLIAQRPDSNTLQPTASAAQPAIPAIPVLLTEQEQDALLRLAEERGFAVKSQLLAQQPANADQLFSCLAEVDTRLATRPQVRLGL